MAAKLTSVVGKPVEYLIERLPQDTNKKIEDTIRSVLYTIVDVSTQTMDNKQQEASTKLHKLAVATTGLFGGFFGVWALLAELPVSTIIMMRSILDVARSEGFDITHPSTKMECIAVFGFTVNEDESDDSADSGYYASRIALSKTMDAATKELVKQVAEQTSKQVVKEGSKQMVENTAPKVLAEFINAIAKRLGITLTEKSAAQVVPLIGAISGATLNIMFTDYYQDMARGHFIIKRLEQRYGADFIKEQFDKIRLEKLGKSKPTLIINTQPK